MTIECFVLLLIIMTSKYAFNEKDRDIDMFIRKEKDKPKFNDMLKKILGGGSSTQKVDNFLREQRELNPETDIMQEIPGYLDPGTGEIMREDEIARTPFPYNPAGLPDDVYRATQRQYGKKSFGPYTSDDMRLIQQYFGGFRGV